MKYSLRSLMIVVTLACVLLGGRILVGGLIAKWLTSGSDPKGCFVTIIIGIVGAAIGGWIGTQLGLGSITGFDLRSLALAVIGAVLLLLVLRAVSGRPAE